MVPQLEFKALQCQHEEEIWVFRDVTDLLKSIAPQTALPSTLRKFAASPSHPLEAQEKSLETTLQLQKIQSHHTTS